MELLLHPTYFPNIATATVLAQHSVCWEVYDNYQKQTYRNRCYICNDSGKHLLSIPIRHVGGQNGRQRYADVKIDNSYAWQRQHWRTLETAYRTSPFFEFYEDELLPLFEKKFEYLIDLNFQTIQFLMDCLQTPMPDCRNSEYQTEPQFYRDARFLVRAKNQLLFTPQPYTQVFGDRHGFVPNTSTLDLLFNEGPNALAYLKQQKTDFLNG